MLNPCESIVEPFIEKTLENPDRVAITLISDDDSEVRFVERGWVVKTYNGRMVRFANRTKYKQELLIS